MIDLDDFLFFLDEVLDAMVVIMEDLGDDLANTRPDIDAVNSPYVTLTHCLGVMEHWGGQVIAGRPGDRDREAEFTADGSVAALVAHARRARAQLAIDLTAFAPYDPPRGPLADAADTELPLGATQGGALVHLYSELAIHRGHIEICRDIVLSRRVPSATQRPAAQPDSRYRSTD
jgi:hypothetical protein